jgi:hypothetical protein
MQTLPEIPAAIASRPAKLYTDLFEVLQVLQDEMVEADDRAIVATMLYLFRSGQIQFLRQVDWHCCDDMTAA